MKTFLDDDFLLQTRTAKILYHDFAENMPIIDFHSHLNPEQIASNMGFENVTQPWLYGDHYKWRAMRANGVSEDFITGNKSDWEKFQKWAETVPYTLRNPLYHWTHLELRRYFGITDLLHVETAESIFKLTANLMQTDDYRVVGLLKKMNVELVCTTDDPIDNLEFHDRIKELDYGIRVYPTWRPDKTMAVENIKGYNAYLDRLSEVTGIDISTYSLLLQAIKMRHDYFSERGCLMSDHGLENFYSEKYTESEIQTIFRKIRSGKALSETEILKFKSALLVELALTNHEKGWTQQFHIGAIRNNNTRLFNYLGPDTGFDSIGDFSIAIPMARFLDNLDRNNKLTKTILYNLNPKDNEVFGTMIGNFQDGTIPGKMQFGPGWWFLDQKDGMEKQISALSNLGLLSRFVGMLTDSRSFLSFPRHEYFRRILCNMLGNDIEKGELPNDRQLIGNMVKDICYNNAKNYLKFN